MKKYLLFQLFLVAALASAAQEVIRIKNNASITIQNGVELTLQGGISLDNGSNLTNNGTVLLKNNAVANVSDWIDNSVAGVLSGNGLVIFNSANNHNFWGATNFYNLQMNAGSLLLNNNFKVNNNLHLITGKINTGANYVFLNNNNAASLLNDFTNAGYTNSWVNGNFKRLITTNTSTYDFPVGNATRSNLLKFANNNIAGTNFLTASFGVKPGTDAGLNVFENPFCYSAVNSGGVWYLNPDATPSAGNYALQLYFNGFTGLTDNQFGILRRPEASSNAADWKVPPGSSLELINGSGRKLSDGFARRKNISSFSQLGIGMFIPDVTPPVISNLTATPAFLWPPNHKMINVTINYSTSDNCSSVNASLSVVSNEPINGTGDGDTSPDWEIVDAHHVKLRAERAGIGTGRIYTITIKAIDAANNISIQTVKVYVNHDNAVMARPNTTEEKKTDLKKLPTDLTISVQPNPTTQNFRLFVNSADMKTAIQLRIFNSAGQIVEGINVVAGKSILFGDKLIPGVYMAEVIQGKERQAIKLIKL